MYIFNIVGTCVMLLLKYYTYTQDVEVRSGSNTCVTGVYRYNPEEFVFTMNFFLYQLTVIYYMNTPTSYTQLI